MLDLDTRTEVRLTRLVFAPRQRVFDAWVKPELRKKWWRSRPSQRCTVCEIDGRPGGKYRLNMVTDESEAFMVGEFVEFVPPERLTFTWAQATPEGNGPSSLVSIDFVALDDDTTELTLVHEQLESEESVRQHELGWIGCLTQLGQNFGEDSGAAEEKPGFRCTATYNATQDAVYEALTSPEGLRGWWSMDAEVATEVGGHIVFRFGGTDATMRIDRLEPGREVVWTCVDQHFGRSDDTLRDGEWNGTVLRFQIAHSCAGGTELLFTHEGLTPDLACYGICESGWTHYIKVSLREYLEAGVGRPYGSSAARVCA